MTAHCNLVTGIPVSSDMDGSRIDTAEVLALTMSAETQVAMRVPVALRFDTGPAIS